MRGEWRERERGRKEEDIKLCNTCRVLLRVFLSGAVSFESMDRIKLP